MFTDQFPEPGIKYNYYLIACDSSNNLSVPSDIRTARILADNKELDLVNSFTAKYNKRSKSVNLSWKVSEQEEIKSFIVYRKMDETENFKPISGNIKKTEFSDKIDKDEGVFYYRISVITKSNNIQYSKTETITIK
ncbi:MAG: hypothetical protein JXR36_11395 [Bacteroidales bacterium]|nr:hypothetical protein [Bacteroidales bacterium]